MVRSTRVKRPARRLQDCKSFVGSVVRASVTARVKRSYIAFSSAVAWDMTDENGEHVNNASMNHAVDSFAVIEMQDFTTKAELAREHGLDQRDPRLQQLEPAGQVKLRGGQQVKLYNKEEAKRVIAEALREAAIRYSKS